MSAQGLADRAHVYVDGPPAGVLERNATEVVPDVPVPGAQARVELLVESVGRINYGAGLGERKGVRQVLHTQQILHGWRTRAVELGHGTPGKLRWDAAASSGRGPFSCAGDWTWRSPATRIWRCPAPARGTGGNGLCLGRYWTSRGPQRTLYLPWPLLRVGGNEIVVLELDADMDTIPATVETRDAPDLG